MQLATRVLVRSVRAGTSGTIAKRKQTERWGRMAGRIGKATSAGNVVLQRVAAVIPSSPEDLRVLENFWRSWVAKGCLGRHGHSRVKP